MEMLVERLNPLPIVVIRNTRKVNVGQMVD